MNLFATTPSDDAPAAALAAAGEVSAWLVDTVALSARLTWIGAMFVWYAALSVDLTPYPLVNWLPALLYLLHGAWLVMREYRAGAGTAPVSRRRQLVNWLAWPMYYAQRQFHLAIARSDMATITKAGLQWDLGFAMMRWSSLWLINLATSTLIIIGLEQSGRLAMWLPV